VRKGRVVWETITYRAASGPIETPSRWELRDATEWIDACGDRNVRSEYDALTRILARTDPSFHPLFARRRSLWKSRLVEEVVQAAQLALELEPGCAEGKPLRAISVAGIDTKFFERNDRLVTALLDARFEGEPGRIGLEGFLGAFSERDHWVLVLDLDGNLLPFKMLRVRSSELRKVELRAPQLLIVENESCYHQLPKVTNTIAVLGSGFDLTWMAADWLRGKEVAYWGDMDTWGLKFLAEARTAVPRLHALMMDRHVFDAHADSAVPEPVIAATSPPAALSPDEREFYHWLSQEERGRLEQEFLRENFVRMAISRWTEGCCRNRETA